MLLVRNGPQLRSALAVTKGLAGQVEGLLGKFPSALYGKNALTVGTICTARALKTVDD